MSNSMKGEPAMLYTGNTLREALGKALGTRDQYGRKIERHTYGKQDQSQPLADETRQTLHDLREAAILRAKSSSVNSANLEHGQMEEGFMSLYFTDVPGGEVLDLDGPQAGRGIVRNGIPMFEYFTDRYMSRPFWVLVFAHSHPEDGSAGDQSYLRGLSPYGGDTMTGDRALNDHAPVCIFYPHRRWWTHRRSSYVKFSR